MIPLAIRLLWMALLVWGAWGVRRRGWVGPGFTRGLSRLTLEVFFPCLVLTQIIKTVEAGTLHTVGALGLYAAGMLGVSGWLAALVHRHRHLAVDRRSFVYCAVMPNWIFLPLAIAGPLYGDPGVALVILFNIPMQILLWTVGVAYLHHALRGTRAFRDLVLNPGLLAALVGTGIGIFWKPDPGSAGWIESLFAIVARVGSVTVPVSLVVLGCQLEEAGELIGRSRGGHKDVVWLRLLGAPVVAMVLLLATALLTGWPASHDSRMVLYLIASMPVAVSAPVFLARYGREAGFAAQSVLRSTLVSMITVPALLLLFGSIDRLVMTWYSGQ
ncbi:MAG: AEC family transporter [Verrucomicrobia bacterium]|nr:AEC family transporter [Verrucomicrobiota bacterium]